MRTVPFLLLFLLPSPPAGAETTIDLWGDGTPPHPTGITVPEEPTPSGVKFVTRPTLTVHLPEEKTADRGTIPAVIVIPGGGYGSVCTLTEGTPPARWLNQRGIAAFVLKYRLPNGRSEAPRADARRAIRLVREQAEKWKVDPARVGVWGFSAGGHLAATVSTRFDAAADRPDFSVLFYPVISMQPGVTHAGSRRNLLGEQPVAALATAFSCDEQVTAKTPPTFLLHAADDRAVDLSNSIRYLAALHRHGVPADYHVYETGGHGPNAFHQNPSWESALENWLRRRELLY